MATKGNIRSIRFDDELLEIIESYPGDSFNQRFENLVRYCHKELPKIQAQVQAQRKELDRLRRQCEGKQRELLDLQRLLESKFLVITELGDLFATVRKFSESLEQYHDSYL